MEQEEILDLVDENDQVIGSETRDRIYAEGMTNYRVISLFIVNSEGKLWIPRRTAHKKLFPLSLDKSAAGHVDSGETYEEAFKRETMEELNIDVDELGYTYLGKMTPHEHDTSCFTKVFEIQSDDVPSYNPDDFIEYFWLSPEELLDAIAKGEKTKNDLPKVVKHFYL